MASAAVKVGVDLGDVMSTRDPGGAKQEGDDLYKAVTPGFFAFALLFGMAHGLENLYIVSRTHSGKWYSYHKKYGHVEAWTVRFVRQTGLVEMGMPLNHLHLCERKSGEKGKGAIASNWASRTTSTATSNAFGRWCTTLTTRMRTSCKRRASW